MQPDKLGTIPEAFWWAIVTIGTIGYGDVVPVTALGKLIATCTIFAGLVLMALPVGIIATAFAEQIQRRDFIVTWGMISTRAAIRGTRCHRNLGRHGVVAGASGRGRRSDHARGRHRALDVFHRRRRGRDRDQSKKERVRLGAGQFFGEVAVLAPERRTAPLRRSPGPICWGSTAQDLHALMQRDPRIAERIKDVVEKRVGRKRSGAVKRRKRGEA